MIIVDTDPGIDDAMALLYLRASPKADLHSVSCVFGNADVETTAKNARHIVDHFGVGVPVFRGADAPLVRKRFVPELKVHGSDGFGDTGLAKSSRLDAPAIHAVDHIVETIKQNPGQVTVLALAPMTNLAAAVQKAPEIAVLTNRIVVMGGAFGSKGRSGNIRSHAEANVFYDPEAADIVFGANWDVTIVGLDVTSDCILSSADAEALSVEAGPEGEFLWRISRGYERIYREIDGVDGCCIHDVAAAVCVTHPEYFETVEGPVTVDLREGKLGQTRVVASQSSRPRQRICRSVDANAVINEFLQVMRLYGSASSREYQTTLI